MAGSLTESVFIKKAELSTHLYGELLDIVTRQDDDIVINGILAAIGMAKSYLVRFDLVKLFGDDRIPQDPEYIFPELQMAVKDIAIFNILKLANANVDMAVQNTAKDDAIRWLKNIMTGGCIPDGWPLKDLTTAPTEQDNLVSGFYNDKKTNRT